MNYYRWQAHKKSDNKYIGIGGGIFRCDCTQTAQDRAKKESGHRFKDGKWVQIMSIDKWKIYMDNSILELDIIPERHAKGLLQKFGYDGDYFVNYDNMEN